MRWYLLRTWYSTNEHRSREATPERWVWRQAQRRSRAHGRESSVPNDVMYGAVK